MSLKPHFFHLLKTLLYEYSGVNLTNGQQTLVESRLLPFIHKNGIDSFDAVYERLKDPKETIFRSLVLEAVLINETSFFRDHHPFYTIKNEILPILFKQRQSQRRLSIWSAACSSGQEAYSIAMTIRTDFPAQRNWKIELLGSDICGAILERAQAGSFRQLEVNRGLPANLLVKYFKRDGLLWKIDPQIKKMVQFRRLNLIESWPYVGMQDLILMRNVLLYFDKDTRRTVLQRIREHLRPDGFLFLGAAETTLNVDSNFEQVRFGRTICYRLRS